MNRPGYLDNIKHENDIKLGNGSIVHCYRIENNFDERILNEWSLHIRRNYVADKDLEYLSQGGVDKEDFLIKTIPNRSNALTSKYGARTITGEFAEILVSDFREFIKNEEVFRGRWETKPTPNSPIQGCDIVSFVFGEAKGTDQLIVTESKSQLSSTNYEVLLKAAEDSEKDSERIGETLAFYEHLYATRNNFEQCDKVLRFTKKAAEPFVERFEGSGLTIETVLSEENAKKALASFSGSNKDLYFIYGTGLKELAYDLYERALKC